jgi:signal transduction histidine kinase
MSSSSLKNLIAQHKDSIILRMCQLLDQVPRSTYQDFILRTKEGQRRLNTWVSLIIRALDGDRETFFKDEERVGYSRAVKGFPLSFSYHIHHSFRQVIGEILRAEAASKRIDLLDFWKEIQEANEVVFKGYDIVATSFLKTREDLINEKVTYLQEIYDFTREIITIFDFPEIVNLVLRKMTQFFQVEESLAFLTHDHRMPRMYIHPPSQENQGIKAIMGKALKEKLTLFMDEGKEIQKEIGRSQLKRVVAAPIEAHGRCYGVLALHNRKKGFKFMDKELGLLFQFLYITAVAMENAFMLEEVERSRKELRLLTSRMITIQEEERKRLASDIHDTLAQVLTGIGYKIQFCKELVKQNPLGLTEQLDGLIQMVHQALDQSKSLMTSLRPDLIDTMGLVPALKRHLESFFQETGIQVVAHLPKKMIIPAEVNICLFRIAQEALRNVYKHAKTDRVEVTLQKEDGHICLLVSDQGKGFDFSPGSPWISDQNKMGLLSMKERAETVGGKVMIQAGISRGCRVEAKIPIPQGKPECRKSRS